MAKVIYEARIPLTHYQGDSVSEWAVKVVKIKNSYMVTAQEHGFCHIDNEIIKYALLPHSQVLKDWFYEINRLGYTKKSSVFVGRGSANTCLNGIKDESIAVHLAQFLELVALNAVNEVGDIGFELLDRAEILFRDVPIEAYDIIKNRQTSNEVIALQSIFMDKKELV